MGCGHQGKNVSEDALYLLELIDIEKGKKGKEEEKPQFTIESNGKINAK